jgi:hypothetical protein
MQITDLIAAAEQCVINAEASLDAGRGREAALLTMQFSLTQSMIAIAKILNDWRTTTARSYACTGECE